MNSRLGHCVVVRPLLDRVEVPANMLRFILWPCALFARNVMEGEDIDVGEAHEVHAKDLDAVICGSS